jgi:hypothetical protein
MRRIFTITAVLALAALFAATAAAQAAREGAAQGERVMFEGVTLPGSVSVGDHELIMNGYGLRRAAFRVRVYVGALYLTEPMRSTGEIVARHGPSRIALHMLRDVGRDRLTGAWDDGFRNNTPSEQLAEMEDEVTRFKALFADASEGDRIYIDYIPDDGTRVTINDEERGTIEGAAFNQAVLRIFLGDNPADRNLRDGMLGSD